MGGKESFPLKITTFFTHLYRYYLFLTKDIPQKHIILLRDNARPYLEAK